VYGSDPFAKGNIRFQDRIQGLGLTVLVQIQIAIGIGNHQSLVRGRIRQGSHFDVVQAVNSGDALQGFVFQIVNEQACTTSRIDLAVNLLNAGDFTKRQVTAPLPDRNGRGVPLRSLGLDPLLGQEKK